MPSELVKSHFVIPDWPAPAHVIAFTTTRAGGSSTAPFHSFNLGHHVGDSEQNLRANYQLLSQSLPVSVQPYWLSQVHGVQLVEAGVAGHLPDADAVFTRSAQWACAVLTADCLPVLFCSRKERVVAAAHAGWRGLEAGVLERTVAGMGGEPQDLLAWMGPAIGPAAFEVGPEVRAAFLRSAGSSGDAVESCFSASERTPGHFFADIYGLARTRLLGAGVEAIYGGDFCTFAQAERFYSYRRDGLTGRMGSLIALKQKP